MGACQSQENAELAAKNKEIEKQLNADKRAASSIVKLLLLGKLVLLITIHRYLYWACKHCENPCTVLRMSKNQQISIFFLSGAGECGKSTVLKQMQYVLVDFKILSNRLK